MTALRSNRSGERGFTLLELLVAMVAGMFVILAAFLLSRGATRLFAGEDHAGASQLNLRIGLERMRSDLERAAFMSTPNIKGPFGHGDPDVCPEPNSLGTPMKIQSVLYDANGSYNNDPGTVKVKTGSDLNGLSPDAITVSGNFTGTDSYLTSSVESSPSGGWDVWLQRNFGAMQRLLSAGESGTTDNVLATAFPQNGILRLTNALGSSQYLLIAGVSLGAVSNPDGGTGDAPKIHLSLVPSVKYTAQADVDKRCGISGFGLGSSVNTVSLVKYAVRNLSYLPGTAWAYPQNGPGDDLKYDLIRTELKNDGSEITTGATIPTSIVAEYIVDLKFAFTVDVGTNVTGTFREPLLRAYDFDAPENALTAADVTVCAPSPGQPGTCAPQRIRSIRYRITTRSRDPDRTDALDDGGPGLLRYMVAPGFFARARTIVGEIALINQRSVQW